MKHLGKNLVKTTEFTCWKLQNPDEINQDRSK